MIVDGYDVTVELGDDETVAGTTVWTEVTDVDEMTLPPVALGMIDRKAHKQAGRKVTRRPGWLTPGDGSLSILQTSAQFATLYALVGIQKAMRVTFEDDGSKLEFAQSIGNWQPGVNKDGDNVMGAAVHACEVPVFTPAA